MPLSLGIVSTGSTLSAEMQRYYDKVFLERVQNFQKYNFLATKKSIPANSGTVVYFTRLTQLTANTTALTDGTTPSGISSTGVNVVATASPYGAYEWIGTHYSLTTIDAGLKEHIELMAQNAGESMDSVLGAAMQASNTLLCANSVQLTAMTTSDTMSVSGIRAAVKKLKINKAPKWENGNYRAVLNTHAISDLQGDTAAGNWINLATYNSAENAELLKKGVIGTLYGVDIVETNNHISASSGTSAKASFFAGKGAVAEVDIASKGNARIIHKKSDKNDTSNPLEMYDTLGWKVDAYAAKVLNSDWLVMYASYGLDA